MTMIKTSGFRARLLAGEPLIGSWLKTPSPIVCDVMAMTPLDCVCLDAEHAPFDRAAIDACLSSLRAGNMPALVRPQSAAPEHILNALDCGAIGIVAPHVRSAREAEQLARVSRYGPNGRGYAGSSRAAGYGSGTMATTLADAALQTVVIAQIEDVDAVMAIDDIARVEGVDCLFVGRIDLTVALGAPGPEAPEVVSAVAEICAAGMRRGRRIGMFVGDMTEIPKWRAAGATLFILKSDHAFLLDGAKALRSTFDRSA